MHFISRLVLQDHVRVLVSEDVLLGTIQLGFILEHNPCVIWEASLFVDENICMGMLFLIWNLLFFYEHALLFVRDLPKTLRYLFARNWSVLVHLLFLQYIITSMWDIHLCGRLWVLSPNTERILQMLTVQSLCHVLWWKNHVLPPFRVLLRELHPISWWILLLVWHRKVFIQALVHVTIETCFFNPVIWVKTFFHLRIIRVEALMMHWVRLHHSLRGNLSLITILLK